MVINLNIRPETIFVKVCCTMKKVIVTVGPSFTICMAPSRVIIFIWIGRGYQETYITLIRTQVPNKTDVCMF